MLILRPASAWGDIIISAPNAAAAAADFKNFQNISKGMMGHLKSILGWWNREVPENPCSEC
jgi:hypothetical protein